MMLQQFVYSQFALLFFAAAATTEGSWSNDTYKADQYVTGSLAFRTYATEHDRAPTLQKLHIKPDASVTLGNMGWDTIGMMEMKPGGHQEWKNETYIIDNVRCALMTAITALAIKNDVVGKDREKIAIPFVIATRTWCSLYVTTLDEKGIPRFKAVRFPDSGTVAKYLDISKMSCLARKQVFVALAVLLNKFKQLRVEKQDFPHYKKELSRQTRLLKRVSDLTFPSKDPDNTDQGGGRKKRSRESKRHSEQPAQEAASVGGMFANVQNAFVSVLRLTDSDTESEQSIASPFYFKGRMISSTPSMITKDVFLKVWDVKDVNFRSVESEWMHHKVAFDAGVPVAAPALPGVVRSKSKCGTEHLVFAVEYIQQDPIESVENLVQFSESLIKSVMKLHDAGLLHCDLKPDNIRWSCGVAKLIDFGRAQLIKMADWVPGTEGYEAPEIADRMPCSVKTDAFAVGRTIVNELEAFRKEGVQDSHFCCILGDVARRLSDSNAESRWSLNQALRAIKNKFPTNQGEMTTCFASA